MADANNNDLEGRTTKTTLEHFYPEIHKLAKKYLSLRGSSVSSERVFSLLIKKGPKNIVLLVSLNKNIEYW